MFSCRSGRLRAGDADEVRQHAPRVGALCVAEADGVGHRVRHAQHLQPRQILGAEAGAHAARAGAVPLASAGAPEQSLLAACYLYLIPLCSLVHSLLRRRRRAIA